MKIAFVYPFLPPKFDAIGQYTLMACESLADARRDTHVILCCHGEHSIGPDSRVEIDPSWPVKPSAQGPFLQEWVNRHEPDWLLLQYNPFSYGRWGINLALPEAFHQLRRKFPALRIGIIFHETFVPTFMNWKAPIMAAFQHWQFNRLVTATDCCFVSIEQWTRWMKARFPTRDFVHLPVASNIARVPIDRDEARARLGIPEGVRVAGFFGNAHPSRMLPFVCEAVEKVRSRGVDVRLLYMGPDSETVQSLIRHEPVSVEGPLPDDEVSRRFAALDVYLAPFVDGISTRRTSAMTGLSHGIPTLSTVGINTDSVFLMDANRSFLLSPAETPQGFQENLSRILTQSDSGREMGSRGRVFYETHFDWPVMTEKLFDQLQKVSDTAAVVT